MNSEFITALEDLGREKGIDKEILLGAIEAALIAAYRRDFGGSSQNVSVHMDRQSGEIHVYAKRLIVETAQDSRTEVSLEEARAVDPTLSPGDILEQEVTPRNFGRIAAQTAKQVVFQRIREAERGMIFEEFQSREGDIVTGEVHRVEHRVTYVELGRAEATLAISEQIPSEVLVPGQRIKAYILEVRRTPRGPQIQLSRSHPGLVKRLFELEVPEIHDGTVELKGVAREAGSRSKVAVWARDDRVDPIGACVGPKGQRVQAIVAELRGEKLDIVRWDPHVDIFVANALSPARVMEVTLDEDEKAARILVPEQQLSLAIGKEGQNARLAARLTGWKIDIRSGAPLGAGVK